MTTSRDELTIDDLLVDPLTHTIMKADRVDPSELEAMVRALARRIARLAGRSSGDALEGDREAFDGNAVSRFLRSMDRGGTEESRRVATRSSMRSQLCGASPPW
jgi:hypothetical protein